MNFYIAEPVTRLPLFNFLVRYIFTEVLVLTFLMETVLSEKYTSPEACSRTNAPKELVARYLSVTS